METLLILCATFTLLSGAAIAEVKCESFQQTITKTVGAKYAVFLPKEYNNKQSKKYPLILFLHGAGERGDDLNILLDYGVFTYAQNTENFPFIIVAPQCPVNEQWHSDMLIALLDEVRKKYSIDPDRIYLTGLSMGGTGTWQLATDYPERFAAIAPVCGRSMPVVMSKLVNMPVWVFHGDKDETVNVENSQIMVNALKEAGAKKVKFTIYPEAGHDIWNQTYSNSDLYEWFLAHKRQEAAK